MGKGGADESRCWCGSEQGRPTCCAPLLDGIRFARTAEQLLRSRYSAYATPNADYLRRTWYPATCPTQLELPAAQQWLGLKILHCEGGATDDSTGTVEFVARYKVHGRGHRLHEKSVFEQVGGRWFYVGGEVVAR